MSFPPPLYIALHGKRKKISASIARKGHGCKGPMIVTDAVAVNIFCFLPQVKKMNTVYFNVAEAIVAFALCVRCECFIECMNVDVGSEQNLTSSHFAGYVIMGYC